MVNTVRFLADPLGTALRNYEAYGPIYRNVSLGTWRVALFGPDASQLVLRDKDGVFSSEQGWGEYIARLFPRGLMLLDFAEHRTFRQMLSPAFTPDAMAYYFRNLQSDIARGINDWSGSFKLHPAMKQLTLHLAAASFLGIEWGPDADRINRALVAMVQASIGIVRKPIPGTKMWRGERGRAMMCDFFAREIPNRRGRGGGDFFTQFCNIRDERAEPLAEQDVIDQMNFLMMAAHDTLTSSLTSTVYYLAKHPEWQEWAREEVRANPVLEFENLSEFPRLEMCFKEALRLHPPVPAIPRRATKDFIFQGYRVPAGAYVGVNPLLTHRIEEFWPNPHRYDPMRFSADNAIGRHKYAWVPFGGGAHMCIGLHFALMQAKVFLHTLLSQSKVELAGSSDAPWKMWPMPKPRDGLPINLRPIGAG